MEQENECLANLKGLIAADNSLDNLSPILSDRFLIHFVRGRRYDSQRAYETLLGYVNIRRGKYKDWFKTIQPTAIKHQFFGHARILKHRDPLNRVVVFGDFGLWDTRKMSLDMHIKLTVLLIDEIMNFEDAEKNGVVIVFDMTKFGFQHAKLCTPFCFSKCFQLFWKNIPLRYIAIHIVNEMSLVTMVHKVAKLILPEKFMERIHFHSNNYESLHTFVPPELLPITLGGNLPNEGAFDSDFEQRIFNKDDYYQFG